MPTPSQPTNPTEKTSLIYPSGSPVTSLPPYDENDENAFLHHIDEGTTLLSKEEFDASVLPDVKANWTLVNQIFYFVYFPLSIWFIMINEAIERFSFYGMRVLLPNYLANTPQFHLNQDSALSIISIFSSAAYFTPVLGSFLADMVIGKYWTITSLSLIYCLGGAITAVTAIPAILDKVGIAGIIVGLIFIAIGTGGIKSSVSSFAADQFATRPGDRVSKVSLLTSFFTIFYLSVNVGSTVSVIMTPLLRNYFDYWVAFMIPAILLLIGTAVFASGKTFYHHVKPGGFILGKAARCFVTAALNYRSARYSHLSKWDFLGRAEHLYGAQFIQDLREALNVVMYLPPILFFFSLSDLSSAIWIYQAELMDRTFFGLFSKPVASDQLSFLNPVIVICMAPVLDRVVYPLVDRFIIRTTPLRKMYIGFIITTLGMSVSGALEILVETYPGKVPVICQFPQYVLFALAELLIAIPAMDFAYQEGPAQMKSMLQACFMLYISCGDLFNLLMINLLAPIPFFQPEKTRFADAYRMFVFTGVMAIALVYFFLTTFRYKGKMDKEAEKRKQAEKLAATEASSSIQGAADEY